MVKEISMNDLASTDNDEGHSPSKNIPRKLVLRGLKKVMTIMCNNMPSFKLSGRIEIRTFCPILCKLKIAREVIILSESIVNMKE